jgi:protoporphyrinogen oxidase
MKHAPEKIRDAARALSHVSVLNINLGVEGDPGGGRHWIYVPEPEFMFHRAGFPSSFSDTVAPPGYGSIYLEIAYDPKEGIDQEYALEKSIADLKTMGILKKDHSIPAVKIIDIPYAYVIFNKARQTSLPLIKEYLGQNNIYSVGRFGAWEYTSMEDAFMQGVSAVREIKEAACELEKEVTAHAFARGAVG